MKAAGMSSGASIGGFAESVFPHGSPYWHVYVAKGVEGKPAPSGRSGRWIMPPGDPVDVFALAALLLSRSGAYHHVQPATEPPDPGQVRRVAVQEAERRDWREAGLTWATAVVKAADDAGEEYVTLEPPALVLRHWRVLRAGWHLPVFEALGPTDDPPDWWRSALALLVIADEACRDVGFVAETGPRGNAPTLLMESVELRIRKAMESNRPDGEGEGAFTLSAALPDVACVLPKSRTPSLGCTLRSLSHNLAFLPPRGLARARWLAPAVGGREPDATSPLNLVLVPYPYRIPARAFGAEGHSPADSSAPWGWFGVGPLSSARDGPETGGSVELLAFTDALIEAAAADVGAVHGVVFPELALSGLQYDLMVNHLVERFPTVEFVVAGLHSHLDGRPGNFAAATIAPARRAGSQPIWVQDIRQKHHRWRLDARQITSYALGASLDPTRLWWERLDVLSRSLTVGVLRGTTTITTLICEDLARVDPAQELLRAIGPNIVIALLMDSAQLLTRWPNRYATVLAEDPGSSVLTLTSLGLVQRANQTGFFAASRCIALWRDDLDVRELHLPPGAQALCITLTPASTEEATLDGRSDSRNSLAWRLSGVLPVAAPMDCPTWRSA